MGLRNISAVYAMWPDLAPLPKVLLVWMALKALDPPGGKNGRPPFLYFDGEASLIAAGGRSRTQTYAALKVLRDRGAVEIVEAGRLRHQAVYKVALDPLAARAPVSGKPDPRVSGKPDASSPENRTQLGPENRTPRSTEGGSEEDGEEQILRQGSTCTAPVDNSGQDEIDAEMTTEQAHHILIARHSVRVHDVIAQHQRQCGCTDAARHLVNTTPTLRVIPGRAA